mgnify:FL=1
MKVSVSVILLGLLISGCINDDLSKELEPNPLEPTTAQSILKIDTVIRDNNLGYSRIKFSIARSKIKGWNDVRYIYLIRSMGASTKINRDSSEFIDLAYYDNGDAWVKFCLLDVNNEVSAMSKPFHFIVQ